MKRLEFFLYGFLFTVLLQIIYATVFYEAKLPVKSIDREYFLEVSEDSIYVESRQGKVYRGKYEDLDSLINLDNL